MKNLLLKLTVLLFGWVGVCITSILIMIHGWGLKPQSWSWIIGGYVVLSFVTLMVQALGSD